MLSGGPSLPSPRCTRLQMFNIFFCDFTEPKSTKTDSSGCRTSALTSPSASSHLLPPSSHLSSPLLPLFLLLLLLLPSDCLQPVASPPPARLTLASPVCVCVSVVLIWTLVLLPIPSLHHPSRLPTYRETSHANTHTHTHTQTHTYTQTKHRHTFHSTHAWNAHIQYLQSMPARTHTPGKHVKSWVCQASAVHNSNSNWGRVWEGVWSAVCVRVVAYT